MVREALSVLGITVAVVGSQVPATHDDLPAEHQPTVRIVANFAQQDCGRFTVLSGSLDTLTASGITFRIIEPPDLTA
jgi:hypothetical protein